ncbi:double-stranded RNA-binding protein Staufen homolog 2 isoform X3 [Zootermopsis nevadensis]|uniref:double-stranded RNA-binding protein Staufen homolog 2 isoform X3 n=1 Tax=Zootermopsis nevadensis TaxID=136037 RepID=UPI000B8ED857|nr:double-stranded RNA-binding protein Staufen homolog 2 isoform X3 [Zootermopsis nevadensis]
MLHHQHSMAMPANQHRDARLGQVAMRMQQHQQHQPLPQQTQQRQTILMGMQPQASGPGRERLLVKPSLMVLIILIVLCLHQTHGAGVFTVDDLDYLFGANGCIEGVLVSMPPAPVVAAAAPVTQQMNSNNKNIVSGIASPLLGVTASESETAATPGHQRQQLQQQTATQLNGTTSASTTTLANTKEKTPMCLVNELARFNKIQHQYRLTNEQGPAHKKRFTVTLKLGDEEYSAEGASIKKAQHSAASEALEHTQYKHPPPKTQRNIRLGKSNITPTVELNALAMKRGEPAVYTFMEPSHHHGNHSAAPHNAYLPPPAPPGHNFNYRGMYNQVRGFPNYEQNRRNAISRGPFYTHYDNMRYHYGKGPGGFQPPVFTVSLRVGAREFLGDGPTAQAARHDAASKALHQLKSLPLPEDSLQHCNVAIQENGISCGLENDPNADLKSPISLVHEIALKRNLPVNFEVVSEKGPPHMRTFVTKCAVGDRVTTGEGNGKKVSKKRAAEKMLEELKKLPPQSPTNMAASMARLKRKANPGKKKTRNLIKVYQQEQKAEPEYGEDINPISRLIQIQQAKKEREPVYSLLEERGVPRRREFVMEVHVGQHSCTGTGPNKKLAKRAAAEGLLQLLGYSRPAAQPVKPSIKTGDTNQDMDKNRKVTFLEDEKVVELPAGGSSGRQLVPGLLLMADNTTGSYVHTPTKNSGVNLQTTAAIAKELLKGGNSPTAEALAKSGAAVGNHKNSAVTPGMATPLLQQQVVRPKDQLLYLAQLLGFQVQFSDFPKGNHSEFLSLVSLSTDPPQVCHGAGQTTDASHDQAALTALRALSEMGLDSVAPSGSSMKDGQQGSQGDSLHLTQKAGSISHGK